MDTSSSAVAIGFYAALDFCVWILEIDGLHVAPFDRHRDGDASLDRLGLNAQSWRAWVRAVSLSLAQRRVQERSLEERIRQVDARFAQHFHQSDEAAEARSTPGRLLLIPGRAALLARYGLAALAERRALKIATPSPPELWPEGGMPTQRLSELWRRYRREELGKRRRYWKGQSVREYMASPEFQALKGRLATRRSESSVPVLVCFVNYPGPVIYSIRPSTAIIGTRNWSPGPRAFEEVVTSAVGRLLRDQED